MNDRKYGAMRLGRLLTAVGVVGALSGAAALVALDLHLVLRAGAERVAAAANQLLGAPELLAHAKLLGLGLVLLGGGSLLLATGLGILIGLQAVREAREERVVPEPSAREAVLPPLVR